MKNSFLGVLDINLQEYAKELTIQGHVYSYRQLSSTVCGLLLSSSFSSCSALIFFFHYLASVLLELPICELHITNLQFLFICRKVEDSHFIVELDTKAKSQFIHLGTLASRILLLQLLEKSLTAPRRGGIERRICGHKRGIRCSSPLLITFWFLTFLLL